MYFICCQGCGRGVAGAVLHVRKPSLLVRRWGDIGSSPRARSPLSPSEGDMELRLPSGGGVRQGVLQQVSEGILLPPTGGAGGLDTAWHGSEGGQAHCPWPCPRASVASLPGTPASVKAAFPLLCPSLCLGSGGAWVPRESLPRSPPALPVSSALGCPRL